MINHISRFRIPVYTVVWIAIFSFLSPLKAQDQDSCLSVLHEAYQKLTDMDVKPNQEFYISYSLSTYPKEGDKHVENYTGRISDAYFINESEQLKLYADKEAKVTIVGPSKKIVIEKSNKTDQKESILGAYWEIVEQYTRTSRCQENNGQIRLELTLNADGQAQSKISRMIYTIDSNTLSIQEIDIRYKSNAPLKRILYRLNTIEIRPIQQVMPALKRVYTNTTVLKPIYRDFKVLDYRK